MFGNRNNSSKDNSGKDSQQEMGFLGHLEELRNKIIWSVLALVIASILSGIYINEIMDLILLKPAIAVKLDLQNLRPFGQPFLYFKVIFVVAIIMAFPFFLYQLWRFIAPGLYVNERRWARYITLFTTICFLLGILFAYYFMIPSMLSFAASFGSAKIKNIIDVNEYFSFITIMLLAMGLIFEMPMIAFILSRVGILTPQFLRKHRKHSIIIILILAAAITPTTDPVSMLIFAAPLFVLFEISILISAIGSKQAGFLPATLLRKLRRYGIIIIFIISAAIASISDPVSILVFALPLYLLLELFIFIASPKEKQRDKE
jgi:sec-independent protein translocase protein TatC